MLGKVVLAITFCLISMSTTKYQTGRQAYQYEGGLPTWDSIINNRSPLEYSRRCRYVQYMATRAAMYHQLTACSEGGLGGR